MAEDKSPMELCDNLLRIFTQERLVLFAGAGVGVQAGLPDWNAFINHLVSVAQKFEKETALIMKARAKAGLLDEAVFYYKICTLIPEGVKFAELAAPFQDDRYDPTKLDALVNLPFEAIVTTNFDRSLDNSWAFVRREAPRTFERDDGSLKQAAYCDEFYIARIHGRASQPQFMVVSSQDYAQLDEDAPYKDFLVQNILTRRTCLFLGYSFLDPAINKILQLLERHIGPTYPRKHYALVPSDSDGLAAKLARFNIQVVPYRDREALWGCIASLPAKLAGVRAPEVAADAYPLPFESMRVFLASCYVQRKLSPVAAPLRDQVLQGITLSLVEQSGAGRSVREVSARLRQIIPLNTEEAELVTSRAATGLVQKGWVTITDGRIELARQPEKILDQNLGVLVRGALARLFVREGVDSKPAYDQAVRATLEQIFLTRGMDLGAQFAGARPVATKDLYPFITSSFRKALTTDSFERQDRLANAVYDLLRRPDDTEAQILADVARLSFGLNVLLQMGNSALKMEALPERVYFDASILMPAITNGYPARPVYQSTIQKLGQAVAESGKTCELLVSTEFLNEIVFHRTLAVQMVQDLGLDDRERLERHILYYGAENTNVFVGAYGSWVGRQWVGGEENIVPFEKFLEEAAPYGNESELGSFIERFGIRTIKVSESDPEFHKVYLEFLGRLSRAYRELEAVRRTREKPQILIQHEAKQLAQIELELKLGRRALFVTADRSLREILGLIRLGGAWNVVISHLGLVQLIDLLLGVDAEPRSFARVLWGILEVEEHAALRNYFIDLALKRYDEALVMALPEIVDEFATDAERAAKLEAIHFSARKIEDKAKAARFLDRFEKQFYEKMAEAVQRRKKHEE